MSPVAPPAPTQPCPPLGRDGPPSSHPDRPPDTHSPRPTAAITWGSLAAILTQGGSSGPASPGHPPRSLRRLPSDLCLSLGLPRLAGRVPSQHVPGALDDYFALSVKPESLDDATIDAFLGGISTQSCVCACDPVPALPSPNTGMLGCAQVQATWAQ
eukprot:gene4079-4418_t